ncbi:MAG: hypothetical protein ACREQP_20520 [Candidatus Binatia bacterium]
MIQSIDALRYKKKRSSCVFGNEEIQKGGESMKKIKLLASIPFLVGVVAIGACTNTVSSEPDVRSGRSFQDGDSGSGDSGGSGSDSGSGGSGGSGG